MSTWWAMCRSWTLPLVITRPSLTCVQPWLAAALTSVSALASVMMLRPTTRRSLHSRLPLAAAQVTPQRMVPGVRRGVVLRRSSPAARLCCLVSRTSLSSSLTMKLARLSRHSRRASTL